MVGAAMNDFLMQFQADILGIELARAANLETTALGAAFLAGLAVGYWKDMEELKNIKCGRGNIPANYVRARAAKLYKRLESSSCSHTFFAKESNK